MTKRRNVTKRTSLVLCLAFFVWGCHYLWLYSDSKLPLVVQELDFGLDRVDSTSFHVGPPKDIACKKDCQEVKDLLKNWTGKPKGAIYIVTTRGRKRFVARLLHQIKRHMPVQYPVILLYTDHWPNKEMRALRECANSSEIFFQQVYLEIPAFLQRAIPNATACNRFGNGRFGMYTRYKSLQVYDEPILQGFDYLLRLSDESQFTGDQSYDIFEYMQSHNISYGYRGVEFEKKVCTLGLWESTRDYVISNKIAPTFFFQWPLRRSFYNNFEITPTSIFRTTEYRALMTYYDLLGGIFYNRWGDGAMKTLAVTLFVPRSQLHHFGNIPYAHEMYAPETLTGFERVEGADLVENYLDPNLKEVDGSTLQVCDEFWDKPEG
jgi:hypothetical protein